MKCIYLQVCFLWICASAISTEGSNILVFFPVSTFSHRIAIWPLLEILAENHNVTMLNNLPPVGQNLKIYEFTPEVLRTFKHEVAKETAIELRLADRRSEIWNGLPNFAILMCEAMLTDPEIQNWIQSSTFDLVILGSFFNDCGLGLVYKFQAKHIIFTPTSILMWHGHDFGHVPESSWIPDLDNGFPQEMTFMERVQNTLNPLIWHFWTRRVMYLPSIERIIRKNLDVPDMPSLEEMWRKTSLIFLNTHHSIEYARSLPPVFISVAGMHIREHNGELSQELTDFLDASDHTGFIYFSFGSIAKPSMFPPYLLQTFIDVFASFIGKARFVWAFDSERPTGMPINVFTVKWTPQQAVLAHKNIKGFITHGGRMSVIEAVSFKVPLIFFPLFGDQDSNADSMEGKGCGIKLEIRGLETDALRKAISKILTDNSYKQNMIKISNVFNDRPKTPLETAVWWTEFVLRNNDTSFLKPLGIHQSWYEVRLLDVWAFIFAVLFIVFVVLAYITKLCIVCRRRRSVSKVKRS